MNVVLMMVGDIVVEHQNQVLDIQATGSDTCCNQDATNFALEIRDSALPVTLVLTTMQAQTGVSILQEVTK